MASLGDWFTPTWFFSLPIGRPKRPRRLPAGALSAVPAVKVPIPAPPPSVGPFGTPEIFPTGPAANDPLFRRVPSSGLGGAGRLFGYGGLIITGAEILVGVIAGQQLERMGDILSEQDRLLRERWLQRAKEKLKAEIKAKVRREIEQRQKEAAESREIFESKPDRPLPAPSNRPDIFGAPDIFSPEIPSFPAQSPDIVRLPKIDLPPLELPLPAPAPVSLPGSLPGLQNVLLQSLGLGLSSLPFQTPSINTLTVGDPALLQSASNPLLQATSSVGRIFDINAQPQPKLQKKAARECEEVKRRRKRKGKCREGFFREYPGKTRYTTWRERDCAIRSVK